VPDLHKAVLEIYNTHNLGVLIDEKQMKKGADLARINHILDAGNLARASTLSNAEKDAIDQQRSLKFWNDPKMSFSPFVVSLLLPTPKVGTKQRMEIWASFGIVFV